jgi:hypothetical protein
VKIILTVLSLIALIAFFDILNDKAINDEDKYLKNKYEENSEEDELDDEEKLPEEEDGFSGEEEESETFIVGKE